MSLLCGYGPCSRGGRPYVGDGLITAGLLPGAVAVGAAIGYLIRQLVTVGPSPCAGQDDGEVDADAEVNRARQAW